VCKKRLCGSAGSNKIGRVCMVETLACTHRICGSRDASIISNKKAPEGGLGPDRHCIRWKLARARIQSPFLVRPGDLSPVDMAKGQRRAALPRNFRARHGHIGLLPEFGSYSFPLMCHWFGSFLANHFAHAG
jgi:hypothetical protein